MSKRKKQNLLFWLTSKPMQDDARFIQIGNSLLLDKRVQALSAGAFRTYLCMCMEAGGKQSFVFPRHAAKKYGIKETSLIRHVKELEKHGFIDVTHNANLRKANEFIFSYRWKSELLRRASGEPDNRTETAAAIPAGECVPGAERAG